MAKSPDTLIELVVTDIDNTLFDWVNYYVRCFTSLLHEVSKCIHAPVELLMAESKEAFETAGSVEYPFIVQILPAVRKFYGDNTQRMLDEAVSQGRQAFLTEAENALQTYPGIHETFQQVRRQFPNLKWAALTDAPRYVAMWKLNKLGLLEYFDSIYGLSDPKIPLDRDAKSPLVDREILFKHLSQQNFHFPGRIRVLPEDYEKPGVRGLKTVLMDYGLDGDEDRKKVLWIGDNLRKDVHLGEALKVRTAWAKYGAFPSLDDLAALACFSPTANQARHVHLPTDHAPKQPPHSLERFSDVLLLLKGNHEPT